MQTNPLIGCDLSIISFLILSCHYYTTKPPDFSDGFVNTPKGFAGLFDYVEILTGVLKVCQRVGKSRKSGGNVMDV